MDSELVINVLSAHAANESKVISDNVRMSYAKNFKDKKAYFNPEQLYGYHRDKDGSIIIDEEEWKDSIMQLENVLIDGCISENEF